MLPRFSTKLIIALDFDDQSSALSLVEQLDPKTCALKVGHEMFTSFGPDFVRCLVSKGFKIFLDLKYHDIPNTVSRACSAAAELGVWMMNVHASGGLKMMQSARLALDDFGNDRPLLIAVTVLTSFGEETLPTIGVKRPLQQQVVELASLAKSAGLDGVVSAAAEAAAVKLCCGSSFLTVTPGIRLETNKPDDQTRVITPEHALKTGSDYLVVGRPITQAQNPLQVVTDLLTSIRKVQVH